MYLAGLNCFPTRSIWSCQTSNHCISIGSFPMIHHIKLSCLHTAYSTTIYLKLCPHLHLEALPLKKPSHTPALDYSIFLYILPFHSSLQWPAWLSVSSARESFYTHSYLVLSNQVHPRQQWSLSQLGPLVLKITRRV
jgi:hypothetical protein